MATTTSFKDFLDPPMWRPEAPILAPSSAGASVVWDHRNNATRHPFQYYLRSAAALDVFDPIKGDWFPLASPGLTGVFGAGATAVFHPSAGPRGTLAAGATTTKVILSTSLPAAVVLNQLMNRGDGVGFRIRIVDNAAGASGKTEERTIVANSAGTTPTLYLDSALSFTPTTGSTYEILSGRIFMLSAGTTAAGCWKYYDIATNSYSGNLATTNLPVTIATDSNGLALSEQHVPSDANPGEGFIPGGVTSNGGLLKAIAVSGTPTGTTIGGTAMFADLQANEYTNFQVRIVEDATTPTAVGQRRRIASHTAGATGVFTVAAFAVTPSIAAKFVIENDDDKILMRSSAGAAVYNYNITANTWDITTWAAPVAHGAGVVFEQSFGIPRDVGSGTRHSMLYCVRGGGVSAIDVLDIAAAATGSWANDIVYGNKGQTFNLGTSGSYDPATQMGRYLHLNISGTQRMARICLKSRVLESGNYLRFPQGVAVTGTKLANGLFIDGTVKLNVLYQITHTQANVLSMIIQR